MSDDAIDLSRGIPIDTLKDGVMVAGKVGDDDVLVVRVGDRIRAVGGACTHYHGRLADGLLVGDTVRCPLHHACFNLETGEALRAPALDPLPCWRVEQRGDHVFVHDKIAPAAKAAAAASGHPTSI